MWPKDISYRSRVNKLANDADGRGLWPAACSPTATSFAPMRGRKHRQRQQQVRVSDRAGCKDGGEKAAGEGAGLLDASPRLLVLHPVFSLDHAA